MKLNIYLNFPGNCEEAFDFYKTVFGREIISKSKYSDLPKDENMPIPDEFKDKILHVSLALDNFNLMGCDYADAFGNPLVSGNNFSVMVNVDSNEEADTLFQKLSEGGKQVMPMNNTFWGSYFGMATDRFGISWMISYENTTKKP